MKFILLALLSLAACGESKNSEGDVSIAVVEEETTLPPASPPVEINPTCLSECNPVEEFQFSFGADISIPLFDCKILNYFVFPSADNFQFLIKANCLQGVQAYSLLVDKDGKVLSQPTIVSSPCLSTFKDLKGFAATRLDNEIAVVFTCLTSPTLAKTWFLKIGGSPLVIESFAPPYYEVDYDLKISGSADMQIFAVASKRGLMRINSQGLQLGGTVNLNLTRPIASLSYTSGQWFVISRDASPYWSTRSYCSKVLTNGQLACDKKELGGPWVQIATNSLVVQAATDYTTSVDFSIAAFNPDNCSMGPSQEMGSEVQGNYVLQSSGFLKTGFGWTLNTFDNGSPAGLSLKIYELHLAGKIQSTLTVADGKISHAQALTDGKGLSVFYLDDQNTLHLRKGTL